MTKVAEPKIRSKSKDELHVPKKWKVVFINDDYTPMDFVVLCLIDIFRKPTEEAISIMVNVHEKGKGVAGVYSYEIAETKQHQTLSFARANEFPLTVELEEE